MTKGTVVTLCLLCALLGIIAGAVAGYSIRPAPGRYQMHLYGYQSRGLLVFDQDTGQTWMRWTSSEGTGWRDLGIPATTPEKPHEPKPQEPAKAD